MDVRRWAVTAGIAFIAAFVVATVVVLIAHRNDTSSTTSSLTHAQLSPARQVPRGAATPPGSRTVPGARAGWLGVQMESWPTGGALIDSVVPGGPADAAGLQPGDLIIGTANTTVSAPGDLTRVLARSRPGETLPIQVQRGPLTVTVQVTVGARPSGYANP